jgi:hypothetical protein
MKIKNLLMSAAFLMISGGAMGQTTITAGNAKFVPGFDAELKFYYTNAEAMGGFQMVVSLPEGVSLEKDEEKTELDISGSKASADFFNVKVPSGFECIGVKADASGTTSDGTAYKAGDVLLVCFPVVKNKSYAATSKEKELCTLYLRTSETTDANDIASVKIKGFAGSDIEGSAGKDAQYATSAAEVAPVSAEKIHVLKCDLTKDGLVDVYDILQVIAYMAQPDGNKGDFDGSNSVDVYDVLAVIAEMAL